MQKPIPGAKLQNNQSLSDVKSYNYDMASG
jgi:hypothetical protein